MRKASAIILVLFFWLTFPLNLFMLGTEFVLLVPETYKSVLIKTDSYNEFLALTSTQLNAQLSQENASLLSVDDLEKLVKESITPEWLQTTVEKIIDNALALFKGKQTIDNTNLVIDFSQQKNNFLAAFKKQFSSQLPEDLINSDEILADVPDEVNLRDTIINAPAVNAYFIWLPEVYKYFKIGILILFILNCSILLGIILLLRKNVRSLIRWLGLSFFIPAIVSLPTIIFAKYLLKPLFEMIIVTKMPAGLSLEFTKFFTNISFEFYKVFSDFFLIPFLVSFVLGLGLIIGASFIKKPIKS
jgi:hypothetical protein